MWKQLGKRELPGISTCHLDSTGNFEKYSSFTLRVKPDKTFGEKWESLVRGSACILSCPDSKESISKFSTCRKQAKDFFFSMLFIYFNNILFFETFIECILFIFSPFPSSPKIFPHHPNPPNFELSS